MGAAKAVRRRLPPPPSRSVVCRLRAVIVADKPSESGRETCSRVCGPRAQRMNTMTTGATVLVFTAVWRSKPKAMGTDVLANATMKHNAHRAAVTCTAKEPRLNARSASATANRRRRVITVRRGYPRAVTAVDLTKAGPIWLVSLWPAPARGAAMATLTASAPLFRTLSPRCAIRWPSPPGATRGFAVRPAVAAVFRVSARRVQSPRDARWVTDASTIAPVSKTRVSTIPPTSYWPLPLAKTGAIRAMRKRGAPRAVRAVRIVAVRPSRRVTTVRSIVTRTAMNRRARSATKDMPATTTATASNCVATV